MSTLQEFKKKGVASLQKKLWLKNIHEVPQIDKVIVAMWIGSLATRKSMKDFSELEENMAKITGQVPRMIMSKKAVSNFKLRIDMPAMLQTTLRKGKAYDFLWRMTTLVLPRVRDFAWLSEKSFDKNGNLNIGLKAYNIFPELGLDDATVPMWLQITIVTTTNDKDHTKELLQELWFIFQK